jgi:hypothetical protein
MSECAIGPSAPSAPGRRPPYAGPLEHLSAELEWLDMVVARAVARMRRSAPAASASPIHVSDAEVDLLLAPGRDEEAPTRGDTGVDGPIAAWRRRIDAAIARSVEHGVDLPLATLAARLGLSSFERGALLVCLGPELDRRYDRLYAYLQDDITRQRPSVDLVVGLFGPDREARWHALSAFSAHAPLRRSGAVQVVVDHGSPSGSTALGQLLRLAPRFVAHLLGDDRLDEALCGLARRVVPRPGLATADPDPDGDRAHRLAVIADRHAARAAGPLVVHVHGPRGGGQVELAHAVAARRKSQLIELDVAAVPEGRLDDALAAVVGEAWLVDASALLVGADRLLDGAEGTPTALDLALRRRDDLIPGLVVVTAERPWPRSRPLAAGVLEEVEVPRPAFAARQAAWTAVAPADAEPDLLRELAHRFRLTIGQIDEVTAAVRRAADRPQRVDWFRACRRASAGNLGGLARRVSAAHQWDDLVVDEHRRDQLRALRDQIRLRDRVLDDWGLGRRSATGRGLSALFAGPPGTGKTMAAGVVARDLGLDLYRVDLSQVVSKYIGETEKNLSRIFSEAEASDAVLLFDEADALFGKRTEVSDAHDRWANIEVSYLLQRMEDHDGITVLATNLHHNMDAAFLRRLRFVVEFRFPEPALRRRIWQAHLSTDAPLADDIDLALLADRLALSGASIRNVVLAASFLAAAEDAPVGMAHLLRAARREFDKTGALWPEQALAVAGAGRGGR